MQLAEYHLNKPEWDAGLTKTLRDSSRIPHNSCDKLSTLCMRISRGEKEACAL